MTEPVLFEHMGRMVDAWGNDNGEVPEPEAPAKVDPREQLTQATGAADLTGNATSTNVDEPQADAEPVDLDEMTGKELKAELERRKAAGRDIDATGVSKVGELRELLRADDEAEGK